MSTLIPNEHLQAVIESLFPKKKQEELLGKLNYRSPDARAAVLAEIDKESPGKADQLTAIWSDRPVHAVHFFRVPPLDGLTAASVQRIIRDRFDVSSHVGKWADLPKPRKAFTPYLLKVQVQRSEVYALVRLYRQRVHHLDEESDRIPESYEVEWRAGLEDPGGRIVEVYYSTAAARQAMITTLEAITGEEVPKRRSPGQAKYLAPLRFIEGDIKEAAAQRKWDIVGYLWEDQAGKAGACSVLGRQRGHRFLPIDPTFAPTQGREDEPNAGRGYTFPFKHDDGFKEFLAFEFHFDGIHPHVTFLRRASSLGRRHLLDLLRQYLRE